VKTAGAFLAGFVLGAIVVLVSIAPAQGHAPTLQTFAGDDVLRPLPAAPSHLGLTEPSAASSAVPTAFPTAKPTRAPSTPRPAAPRLGAATLSGVATWYDDGPGNYAAAGPLLRAFLGPNWRGQTIVVCSGDRCIRAHVSDWCLCSHGRRLVDLSATLFSRLAPLGRGVIRVEVSRP
jgi:hypothetical protein